MMMYSISSPYWTAPKWNS